MVEKKLYKDYFDIDPKYYAAVTADLVEQGKVSWKGFYPHDTFVKLLQTTHRVLTGAASRSIWVEGAYGTGKSHAALTIKSLIDASDEEVVDYFNDYGLNQDLRDKFVAMKNSGKIITIHRIGSAGIETDADLVLAVQQSIMGALKQRGIENNGDASMRDAFLKWLGKVGSKGYFNELISQEKYIFKFGGLQADDIVERLTNGTDAQIENLMRDVMQVLKDAGQYGLLSDVNDMANWIKSIIEENDLAAILFVWDEFSEYFLTHPIGLTGFQTLAEISQSHPFYFMIVAHESRNLFADADTAKKILDRFEPSVKIELPENMAFRLMAQSMKKTSDPLLAEEWVNDYAPALNEELVNVRNVIMSTARKQSRMGDKTIISDDELQSIVPIHPYAALLLKHIATVFNSNQRSMFDFIISNDMTEAKGFKWYINHYGPMDTTHNLLTIDLLWDFFCGKEQNGLNDDVRGILDSYHLLQSDKLLPEEQRVLKTLLLLQAIALRVMGDELLVPNDQNLDLAFAGLDWNKGRAIAIANGLCEKNLIFKKPIAGGKFEYSVVAGGAKESIEPYRKKVQEETKIQGLITEANLLEAIQIPPAFKGRYLIEPAGYANFKAVAAKLAEKVAPERFKIVVSFAIDDIEAEKVKQEIQKMINSPQNNLMFVETLTPMGKDLWGQYTDHMAFSKYYAAKDKAQAEHYQKQAASVLKEWQNKIANGAFVLYSDEHKAGQRKANLADLQESLRFINHQKYYYGLEQYPLNETMYSMYQLAAGALCGIEETLSGAYKNKNQKMSFENALDGAWKVEKYWEDPAKQSLPIVHIKKKVDEIVQNGFDSGAGLVSMSAILDEMEKEPFGFMPSSVTALVLGFVLKEYATADYFWSNGSNSEAMSVEKMKMMISSALMQRSNPAKNYKEEYIRSMTPEIRGFLNCTAKAFGISLAYCGSVENIKPQIRTKMKGLVFPIWCVEYILEEEALQTSADLVGQMIDHYTNIVNSSQDMENILAEKIGRLVIENGERLADDLEQVFNDEHCQKGMMAYLQLFENGILPQLAMEIGDGGGYLAVVKKKFNAEEANWAWDKVMIDEKISDVILEYHIIAESNKSLNKSSTLEGTISAWNSRTSNIRISCEAAVGHLGDLGPFLEQLRLIKQNGSILERDKQQFYHLLLAQRESFDDFYKNQLSCFKQAAKVFLSDLTEDEIKELYNDFPSDQFTKPSSEYYRFVEEKVNDYLQSQWKKKLQNLWHEKTGTKNPKEWSEKYNTPILCLFAAEQRNTAKEVFQTILSANPSENAAKNAIQFLTEADFYAQMEDAAYRDQCFLEEVVGDYGVLLQDMEAIKEELRKTVSDPVYDWLNNSSVQHQLRKMADKQYKLTGCDKATAVIDEMDSEQLRRYLKGRIINDVDFGLMILKGE